MTTTYFILIIVKHAKPITVASWSKAWTVFTRSIGRAVCSNLTRGVNVYMSLFCACIVLCARDRLIPQPRSPADYVYD
jgi:hypothetical protein